MKRVSSKTEKEFLKAYENHADGIFRHCFFRVSSREVALDMVQESFAKTWQHLAEGNEIENMKAFVYRVASNLVIDYYRKKRSDSLDALQEEEDFDPGVSDHEDTIKESELSIARKAIDSLDEPYREVMAMRYVDGLSIGEIAEILSESENAVSVRIHRATEKARKIFEPEKDEI